MAGTFVAWGHQGLRMHSANGRDWSKPIFEKKNYVFNSGLYGDGRFVLLAKYGKKAAFFGSENGSDWENLSEQEPDARILDLAYGNGRYVAIGGDMNGGKSTAMISKDAKKWEVKQYGDKNLLMQITHGQRFVAVGYKGRVAVSDDGQTWQESEPLPELDTFISIQAGNGVYVGGGLHGLRMTSQDGIKWEHRVVAEEGQHINSVLWTGEQFVCVGLGVTFFSSDGKTWTSQPNENPPLQATYGNGLFVGSRWKGRILVSQDAIHWEEVLRAPDHITGVCFGEPSG